MITLIMNYDSIKEYKEEYIIMPQNASRQLWNKYNKQCNKALDYIPDFIADIIEKIDRCRVENNKTIHSSISDSLTISFDDLSSGCRVVIAIALAQALGLQKDFVFNITPCGENALKVLFEDYSNNSKDTLCYLGHMYLPETDKAINIKLGKTTFTSSADLIKILNHIRK